MGGAVGGLPAWLGAGLVVALLSSCASSSVSPPGGSVRTPTPTLPHPVTVTAEVETEPVPGDADDPALWIARDDPSATRVIGTDKEGGLAVYDLDGRQLAFLADGLPNNVDRRDDVLLGGITGTLLVAADDGADVLRVYRFDPARARLVDVAARPLVVGVKAHGLCLYRSPRSGRLYAFPNDLDGRTEQWELVDDGLGRVAARLVRGPWSVAREAVEGCVADDELGHLYVSEERRGIWRMGAEPDDPTDRPVLVDGTGPGGHLAADVEGLAILSRGPGAGYLFASSQGDDAFAVYRREAGNAFVGRFRIGPGRVDGCEDTDGIEVTPEASGPRFPEGLFVCQDGRNDDGRTNFKLVPLERILQALEPGPPG